MTDVAPMWDHDRWLLNVGLTTLATMLLDLTSVTVSELYQLNVFLIKVTISWEQGQTWSVVM